MTTKRAAFAAGVVALVAVACSDPAKDKPKATVGQASTPQVPAQGSAPAVTRGTVYKLTPPSSTIHFVGAKVTGSHEGTFQQFQGTVDVPGQNLEAAKIRIEIDLTSLSVEPEKLQAHLLSADFFDVAKFPKASFASTRIQAGAPAPATHTITGDFTLHGVTRSISFPATVTLTPAVLEATSEFSINRKDFGVVYPGMPDDLIRDDVLIKLNLKGQAGT